MTRLAVIAVVVASVLACNLPGLIAPAEEEQVVEMQSISLPTETPTAVIATLSPAPSLTSTSTRTATASPTPSPTPFGCKQPPDDMTRVKVGEEMILNQRTVSMLEHAQELYGGSYDLMKSITQGSYHAGVSASFGTHDGGGAVDLSVRDPDDWNHIVYEDMDAIIQSLRQAGFAAWLRETGDLYDNSPIHIHAIAIGDPDLSEEARTQLVGAEGYFRGFNGLPVDPPLPDTHGSPVICPWMIELGYTDLRN